MDYTTKRTAQLLRQSAREPIGMSAGMPDYGYGNRYEAPDSKTPVRPKGLGYFGEVSRPEGGYSTEISIGTDNGEIPSVVPTLTRAELENLMSMKDSDPMQQSIVKKAIQHALFRRLEGKSPFAGINDKPQLLPIDKENLIGDWTQ